MVLEWRHRDRTQQLEEDIYDTEDDENIGPETGVTYALEVIRTDTSAVLHTDTNISGTTITVTEGNVSDYEGEIKLSIWSERDGFESWQKQERTFLKLRSEGRVTESGDNRTTEDDEYRIVEA